MNSRAAGRINRVRRFNRFYTQTIGVLQDHLLESPFSLAEMRVLYEVARRDQPAAAELTRDLALDAGYLSRLLRDLSGRGLIRRTRSDQDARRNHLSLTARGRKAFAVVDLRSNQDVAARLRTLSEVDQDRLVQAMSTIEEVLGPKDERTVSYLLRSHRPGDLGWVVYRHGVLYAQEYKWDEHFEALVAQIVAEFVRRFNPKREACWIAERGGERVGCVFLVEKSKTVAQLRLLLVEPSARGLGIGRRLVEECLRFARQAGYKKITLWTNSVLHAARHIYEEAGFRLTREESHHSFGKDLLAQTWERKL